MTGDLSASRRYWAEDITEPFEVVDGCLVPPASPGIGVSPLPEALKRFTTSVETIRIT